MMQSIPSCIICPAESSSQCLPLSDNFLNLFCSHFCFTYCNTELTKVWICLCWMLISMCLDDAWHIIAASPHSITDQQWTDKYPDAFLDLGDQWVWGSYNSAFSKKVPHVLSHYDYSCWFQNLQRDDRKQPPSKFENGKAYHLMFTASIILIPE